MADEFITLKLIARQALPRLIENLVFPNLVYRNYSDTFQNLGDTVQVRKPTILTAEEFNAETGVTYQDMKESSVDVRLDRLATVDAATECPAASLRLAVVDISALAEEAFAAERFYVYRRAVTGLHGFYVGADRFHHANHFMAHGNSRHSTRYRAMLNMQITAADASQGYAHERITRRNKLRLGLFLQSKLSVFNISQCLHKFAGLLSLFLLQ